MTTGNDRCDCRRRGSGARLPSPPSPDTQAPSTWLTSLPTRFKTPTHSNGAALAIAIRQVAVIMITMQLFNVSILERPRKAVSWDPRKQMKGQHACRS
jgi:hypothetical protein